MYICSIFIISLLPGLLLYKFFCMYWRNKYFTLLYLPRAHYLNIIINWELKIMNSCIIWLSLSNCTTSSTFLLACPCPFKYFDATVKIILTSTTKMFKSAHHSAFGVHFCTRSYGSQNSKWKRYSKTKKVESTNAIAFIVPTPLFKRLLHLLWKIKTKVLKHNNKCRNC